MTRVSLQYNVKGRLFLLGIFWVNLIIFWEKYHDLYITPLQHSKCENVVKVKEICYM